MENTNREIICPFCDEGVLKKINCKKCGKGFVMCDECESIYRDGESSDDEFFSACPHCGAEID